MLAVDFEVFTVDFEVLAFEFEVLTFDFGVLAVDFGVLARDSGVLASHPVARFPGRPVPRFLGPSGSRAARGFNLPRNRATE